MTDILRSFSHGWFQWRDSGRVPAVSASRGSLRPRIHVGEGLAQLAVFSARRNLSSISQRVTTVVFRNTGLVCLLTIIPKRTITILFKKKVRKFVDMTDENRHYSNIQYSSTNGSSSTIGPKGRVLTADLNKFLVEGRTGENGR